MDLAPLWLSIQVAILATLLAGGLGVLIAALLRQRHSWLADLLDALTTAPLVLPPTVLGYYLLTALGRRSFLGEAYASLTGSTIVFTFTGAVIAASVGALPLVIKSARTAFESVDDRLVAAARTLGASPFRAFWEIELPLSRRGIGAGLVLGFARALGDFGITLVVAGNIPGRTRTASLAIYDAIQAGRDGDALSLVLIMTGLAVLFLWAVNRLLRRSR